jgi:hypothetical protein
LNKFMSFFSMSSPTYGTIPGPFLSLPSSTQIQALYILSYVSLQALDLAPILKVLTAPISEDVLNTFSWILFEKFKLDEISAEALLKIGFTLFVSGYLRADISENLKTASGEIDYLTRLCNIQVDTESDYSWVYSRTRCLDVSFPRFLLHY